MDEEGKEVEIREISSQMNGYPRDFLQGLTEGNRKPKDLSEQEEENQEIELNLGLSLGGRFGLDPNNLKENKNPLSRSSSIAGLTTLFKEDDMISSSSQHQQEEVKFSGLVRTGSLPIETEEEWRKRKELQSLRRMEAKRKMSEKQRHFRAGDFEVDKPNNEEGGLMGIMNLNVEGGGGGGGGDGGDDGLTCYPSRMPPSVPGNVGLPAWARGVVDRSTEGPLNGKSNILGLLGFRSSSPVSQGSSEITEFETRPVQGLNKPVELVRRQSSVQAMQQQSEQKPIIATELSGITTGVEAENPLKKPKVISDRVKEAGTTAIDDMPCVFTKGDGPNGRKIEGFLYKYRKGEELRIVCVCHGSFLTPAEFVKHGGGGDVSNPLRHIVISPPPCFL